MSVIVAIKYKNGIAIGADKQVTVGCSKAETTKIKKTNYSNIIYGAVGSLRDLNVLQANDELVGYKDILDKLKIDYEYIIKKIVPKIFDLLKSAGRLRTSDGIEESESDYIVCSHDGIFTISSDGSAIECLNYGVIGCGLSEVTGYLEGVGLNNISKDEATKYIIDSIKISCGKNVYIGQGIDLLYIEGK